MDLIWRRLYPPSPRGCGPKDPLAPIKEPRQSPSALSLGGPASAFTLPPRRSKPYTPLFPANLRHGSEACCAFRSCRRALARAPGGWGFSEREAHPRVQGLLLAKIDIAHFQADMAIEVGQDTQAQTDLALHQITVLDRAVDLEGVGQEAP
jgi:hypothetical protein